MAINYGSIEPKKPRKKYCRTQVDPSVAGVNPEERTAEVYETRLHGLAFQNRAPSVAKAAAAELLERKSPRKNIEEQRLTADEARRICDIYERIFSRAAVPCPKCGYVTSWEGEGETANPASA